MRKSRIFARVLGIAVVATLAAGLASGCPGGQSALRRQSATERPFGKDPHSPGLQDEAKDDKPIVHVALTPTSAESGEYRHAFRHRSAASRISYLFDESRSPRRHADRNQRCGRFGVEGHFEADRAPRW